MSVKPFIKWVGGKRSILPLLVRRLPKEYNTYHEPFLGGGALFFATAPKVASLSDINDRLITTYSAVRDEVDTLVELLDIHQRRHNKEYYLNVRVTLPEEHGVKLAALFIYLNKTCFNGLYRVNKSGEFNVPIGTNDKPPILREEVLRAAHKALQGVELNSHEGTSCAPVSGDFYYLDPPYYKTFTGYDRAGFSEVCHRTLAETCKKIDKAGASFMLSNSNEQFIKKLYQDFKIEEVGSTRSVSGLASGRGKASELIIRNYV